MHRDADGAGLVGNGAGNGLANPPDGVSGKLVAAPILELLDAFHEADVAFLDQVEEGLAAVGVFLGDGDHQAQVGFGHVRFGLVRAVGGAFQLLEGLEELLARQAHELFQRADLGAFALEGRLLVGGLAPGFQLFDVAQAALELLVDVAGHQDHVLQDPLLVKELRGRCPAACLSSF